MRKPRLVITTATIAAIIAIVFVLSMRSATTTTTTTTTASEESAAVAKPALAVSATTLEPALLPIRISANGNIMAWQEASIGTEADGLRLTEVKVEVGDRVRRGQILAVFAADTVTTALARSRARVAEAEAALAGAIDNRQRADELKTTGAISAQQIQQYLTADRTARAQLEAAQADEKTQSLRLAQTQVHAPDDGVISASSATVGAVLPAGQELFRLIRRGRLEWRAEIAAFDLAKLRPGQAARLIPVGGETIEGKLRMLAPKVNLQTRNGLVYVDLPTGAPARDGMFARGEFDLGAEQAMTLPLSAVQLRDGFSYVLRIDRDSRVIQTKVTVGRRAGARIEITGGIDASARVVASGGSFIGDGDLVRVVTDVSAVASASAAGGTR